LNIFIKLFDMDKQVFFSYAWGGESEIIVNEIDKAFQDRGIIIVRDKRDLGFKGIITDFMKQIGAGSAIVIVISDKYLKSPYCMFELLETYRNLQFKERIFPVVLGDASIFDPLPRLQYLKYWQEKKKELDDAIMQFGTDAITVIGDDYKIYKKIFDNFGEVVNILKDINSLTPQMHKDSNYSILIDAVVTVLGDKKNVQTSNSLNSTSEITDNSINTKNVIRELIHQNKLENALDEMLKFIIDDDDKDLISTMKQKFNRTAKEFRRDLITKEEAEKAYSSITYNLLDLLKNIK